MHYEQEPLGKRLGRFVALMTVIFIITAVVVLSQRLSDEMIGNLATIAVVGVLFLVIVVLLGFITIQQYKRIKQLEEERLTRQANPYPTNAAQPPVIVVAPQAMPGYGQPGYGQPGYGQPYGQPQLPATGPISPRHFTIVGEGNGEE